MKYEATLYNNVAPHYFDEGTVISNGGLFFRSYNKANGEYVFYKLDNSCVEPDKEHFAWVTLVAIPEPKPPRLIRSAKEARHLCPGDQVFDNGMDAKVVSSATRPCNDYIYVTVKYENKDERIIRSKRDTLVTVLVEAAE